MFTCRTGTKFAYGKSDPQHTPILCREVGWGLAQETLCLSCFLSSPSQLQMSSPGCGTMAKSSSCLDGWVPDPSLGKELLLGPGHTIHH